MPVSRFNGIEYIGFYLLGLIFMLYSLLLNWYILTDSKKSSVHVSSIYFVLSDNSVRSQSTDRISLINLASSKCLNDL